MENELVDLVMDDTREKMARAIDHVKNEFGTVRTGRASSTLVEGLLIEYYGIDTPLKQLANFSVPEPRLLVVSPFDKQSIPAIEKAIGNANLGLTPSSDGQVIRLNFPALTEERRKDFVKIVKTKAEEGRVALRRSTPRASRARETRKRRGTLERRHRTTRYRARQDDSRRSRDC
jgi:ribosome recycling factor